MRAGFDPATSAEHVLDALPSAGARSRSGVLIGAPTDRRRSRSRCAGRCACPGPTLATTTASSGDAWHHGRAGVVVLDDGRVQLAIPLRDARDRQYGIVISDGVGGSVPPADLLMATSAVARQHQGLIAVALAFGGLRERAGIEERERLARQIHDGIAQAWSPSASASTGSSASPTRSYGPRSSSADRGEPHPRRRPVPHR